jgi:4-hydroxyacetophenone monooxygenase
MAMAKVDTQVRPELLDATDETIEDAVQYADPMALRGLLYQMTGDEDVAATRVGVVREGFREAMGVSEEADVAMLRRKAAEFLKEYRDRGAGEISIGSEDRLPRSLRLAAGVRLDDEDWGLYLEELSLDPWARSLMWQTLPPPERLQGFRVIVIGSGMGGLNAAVQLKHAGIPYTLIEKNADVGGTWFENRYPGCRVDTPSRAYTNIFGVDFAYPNPFCPWSENERYFKWITDNFELRDDIVFNTEVRSLTWDEQAAEWQVVIDGPEGRRTLRSNAVITAVGFLNRPNIPAIEGAMDFRGPSWHTARWPEGFDVRGKSFAVIGTGCSGYQLIPELALEASHVAVFQRTPQWLVGTPGYRSPFPPQVNWLDRNLPFHTNFMRFRAAIAIRFFGTLSEIDPDFDDPNACNPGNKRMRDSCIEFLKSKLGDSELVETMTPPHPVLSARPVNVDTDYSILDAIQRDNVTLVTDGIRRINETGIEGNDGTQYDVDVIVYATGFHATEYLFPMTITGRDGHTIEEAWADEGARAYRGCMVPGFPNLWMVYGPNTNGGLLPSGFHEVVVRYALECMERLIVDDRREIEVEEDAYSRFNRLVDERNARKVWSDPRASNYYWTDHGRSATMCPFYPWEVWHSLRHPDFEDLSIQ